MSIFSSKKKNLEIISRAKKEGWALGHFNFSTLETLRAIFQAGAKLKSPLIVGTSENEALYVGLEQAVVLVRAFERETGVKVLLNLDHGKSFDYIKKAVDTGYDMVLFDGSQLSLDENIAQTKMVADYCRKRGVILEGEVGVIPGASEILQVNPDINEEDLTKPDDAWRFVKETRVDCLAVNVGTFHGMAVSGENPRINVQLIREIAEKLKDRAFLVLHGGSGTQEEDIKEAIKNGISIIHINTELRIAFTETLVKTLAGGISEKAPYKYLPKAIEEVQKVVEKKINLFNSENKLEK